MSIVASLLLTLYTLAALTVAFFLFIIIVGFHTSGGLNISLLFIVRFELECLSITTHFCILWLLHSESTLDTSDGVLWHLFGEGYLENNVKVSKVVGLLVEGKTFIFDGFNIIRLDNFAWIVLDSDLCSVKMLKNEVNTCEGLIQSDFFFHEQICTLALENLVGLFLHNDDHITGLGTWKFICLTIEGVSLVVRCTLVDFCIDDLLFLKNFLSHAGLAAVLLVNDFSLTITFITRAS